MKNRPNSFLLAASSGVIGVLSFPPFDMGFFAWVAFIPLLFMARKETYGKSFLYGYISGVVFFSGLLYWLTNVTFPGTIALVLLLSGFYGFFALAACYVAKKSMEPLLLPFIWVIMEYIRSYVFSGFPWGLLGYTQYTNIDLIQAADITGVYGISFIIIFFNIALFSYISRDKRRTLHMVGALVLILAALMYGKNKIDNSLAWGNPNIAVVQGNIPQSDKWDPSSAEEIIGIYENLTKEVSVDKPDMIIWPETSYPYAVMGPEDANEIMEVVAETGVPVLAGMVCQEGNDLFNSAFFYPVSGRSAVRYDKTHLVPFGEYVPGERYISFFREYIDKPIGNYKKGADSTIFSFRSAVSLIRPDGTVTRTTNFYKFGVMICFEDIFPYIARDMVRKGADLLVNMTNDAWFGDTAAPEQHVQASVFRAVENRVPVIRAANTGVSCFIDFTGRILMRLEENGRDTFVRVAEIGSVRVSNRRSFYTQNGDFFVFFCGTMVIFILIAEIVLAWIYVKKGKKETS